MRTLLLLLALSLGGCLSNPYGYGEVPKKLALQVRTFEDVVRWGELENMYLFQKQQEGENYEVAEGLDNVRVTGYDAGGLREVAPNRWAQTAMINYVLVDRQVVRELVDQQIWVSDDDGETWYRENPVPVFR